MNYIISDNTITVFHNGKAAMVDRTNAYADQLIDALKNKKHDEIPTLISAAERIKKFSDGKFTVEDGKIFVEGVEAAPALGQRIKDFSDKGLPYQPLIEFHKNLQKNPSKRARNDLYSFLEKNNHPITENGCFIAYKKVRSDFKDVHTGTMDNSVGKIVSMPRTQVDEDPNRTCSAGLHISNASYCKQFYAGGVMLELEVNPCNVVAIPTDYNQSKIRVSEYKVLSVIEQEHQDISLRKTDEKYLDHEDDENLFYCDECGIEIDEDADMCDDCSELNSNGEEK